MSLVCKWIVADRHEIQDHLDLKDPNQKLDQSWWLLLYILNQIMDVYNIFFKEIQGKDTSLHEQNQRFRQLH